MLKSFTKDLIHTEFCPDEFWNSNLSWYTDQPKLSICFRQTVLIPIPALILLLLFPFELRWLNLYQKIKSTCDWVNIIKIAFLGAWIGVQSVQLISEFLVGPPYFVSFLLFSAFQLFELLCFTCIICKQLRRQLRTSESTGFYLLVRSLSELLLFLDVNIYNSSSYSHTTNICTQISFGCILCLFLLFQLCPRGAYHVINRKHVQNPSEVFLTPEDTCSLASKRFFNWLKPLFCLGWKEKLTIQDLFPLSFDNNKNELLTEFEKNLDKRRQKKLRKLRKNPTKSSSPVSNGTSRQQNDYESTDPVTYPDPFGHSGVHMNGKMLLGLLISSIGPIFAFYIFIRVCVSLLEMAYTQLMDVLIGFVNMHDRYVWHGVLFALALGFNNFLYNILTSVYYQGAYCMSIRLRTLLTNIIYRKALFLSARSKTERSSGEIVNLMSVDVSKLSMFVIECNMVAIAPIQIVLCLYLLYQQLGNASYASLVVMVLILPVNSFFSYYSQKLERKQLAKADSRMKALNEVLNGIKVIKLYAWEKPFQELVTRIRGEELRYWKIASFVDQTVSVLFDVTPVVISLATFGVFILSDPVAHVLTPERAFVSLGIINIMYNTFSYLPWLFYKVITAWVSFSRVSRLLMADEIPNYVCHKPDDNFAVRIRSDAKFKWENRKDEQKKEPENGNLDLMCDQQFDEKESDDADALLTSPNFQNGCNGNLEKNGNGKKEEKNFEFVLQNVGLQIRKGEFVSIIGSVGSGKTSLISSILGEMEPICDTSTREPLVNIASDCQIGYVPQLPWIQNSSLKENILFGKEFDAERFNQTIDSCQLRADLAHLAAGEMTEIGEKGINLSGGQKQRVSLARACYSESISQNPNNPSANNLYLFDDPLSAVDAHVGRAIFEHVLSNETGMLRNSTRVLVTNHVHLLKKVDRVLVIHKGEIRYNCTYDHLLAEQSRGVDLKEFGIQFDDEIAEQKDEKSDENLLNEQSEDHSKKVEISNYSNQSANPNDTTEDEKGKLIEEETIEEGKVRRSHYFSYLNSLGWPIFTFSVITLLSQAVFSLMASFYLADWSEEAQSIGSNQTDSSRSMHHLLVYSAFGLGRCLSQALAQFSFIFATLNACIFFHRELLIKILRSPMRFFDTTPLGRIINRFSKDIDVIDSDLPFNLRYCAEFILQFLSILYVILTQFPWLALGIPPLTLAYYFIQKIYIQTARQSKRFDSVTRSPVYSHFSESLAGSGTIRAYGRANEFIEESDKRLDANNICNYTTMISNRWLSIYVGFLTNIVMFGVGIYAVIERNTLSSSVIGLVVNYTINMNFYLNFIIRTMTDIENNIVSVERINEYRKNEQEDDWIKDHNRPPSDWPSRGQVQFENYSTKYRPELEPVLHSVSFKTEPEEKIGIAGRTGAGKSSITLGLFRLLEPIEGRILIDGVDICQIGLHDLRSKLGIIPQDPVLFSGTIRFNLDPFERYTDQQIWNALELCNLKQYVNELASGLQHEVSEGGSNLSLGQKQLVCLARALLKTTKVLVLDEASSSIDYVTDSFIQRTIRSEFSECTIITIAHRLNTIADSDRILCMDKGRVMEFDKPEKLLNNPKSIYYSLASKAGIVPNGTNLTNLIN